MKRAFLLTLFFATPARALSPEAEEFMKITGELESVQCEKRTLRRKIALAEIERKTEEAAGMRRRFADIDRDAKTAKLERRLGQLQPRLSQSADPEDLPTINRQRVEAFYRCD